MTHITKHGTGGNNVLEIRCLGLNININPASFYKENISDKARELLENMLFLELKRIIGNVSLYEANKYENKESIEDGMEKIDCIEELSHFMKYICSVSQDTDVLFEKLNKQEIEVFEWAKSIFSYSSEYGFIDSKTVTV